MRATGWRWDYILDEVTLPIVNEIVDSLNETPLVEELFAAFVGYGKADSSAKPKKKSTAGPGKWAMGQGEVPIEGQLIVDSKEALDTAILQLAMLGGGKIDRRKKSK